MSVKHISEIIPSILKPKTIAKAQQGGINLASWSEFFKFDMRVGSNDAQEMVDLVTACAQFCKEMKAGNTPRWLSLLGKSGAGKTFLAKRIFRWHRDSGHFTALVKETPAGPEVVYPRSWCWWPDMAKLLKGNSGYELLKDYEQAQFVVIDEIGAELDKSGHVTNALANVLGSRVGKWTIITSNRNLKDIGENIDVRVSSRMVRDGSAVVDVDVEDFSIWKQK